MENATKALLMAAGFLLGLMILGALILMFNSLSNYQRQNTINTREAQIQEFNEQYETYDRKNVRGTDIVSILNRVADYNERKSAIGTQGAEIAFQEMKITVELGEGKNRCNGHSSDDNLSYKNNLLITGDIEESDVQSEFAQTMKETQSIEAQYGKNELLNILNKCVSDGILNEDDKQTFNKISSRNKIADNLSNLDDIKEEIYKYQEYVNFKKLHFDCVDGSVKYNKTTGRIIEMKFRFNGKME